MNRNNCVAYLRHRRALYVVPFALAISGGLLVKDLLPENCNGTTDIFQGISYGCQRLKATDEGDGLLYWVRINLTAPGIQLYVTPLDPTAVAQGWQYRLHWIQDVVRKEHLAVAVNGTMFVSDSGWRPRLPGDLANSVETVVGDHVVSHVWEYTYLLWFDDQLTPHLDRSKRPGPAVLATAKWGIGGQGVGWQDLAGQRSSARFADRSGH